MSWTAPAQVFDHQLIIGDTYLVIGTMKDEDGTAFDIAGATGVCEIRTAVGGTLLASPTVSLYTDGTDGKFQFTLAAATTAALTENMRARYSVRLTFTGLHVRTVLEGVVAIRSSVVA